jgi:hypothetical protein
VGPRPSCVSAYTLRRPRPACPHPGFDQARGNSPDRYSRDDAPAPGATSAGRGRSGEGRATHPISRFGGDPVHGIRGYYGVVANDDADGASRSPKARRLSQSGVGFLGWSRARTRRGARNPPPSATPPHPRRSPSRRHFFSHFYHIRRYYRVGLGVWPPPWALPGGFVCPPFRRRDDSHPWLSPSGLGAPPTAGHAPRPRGDRLEACLPNRRFDVSDQTRVDWRRTGRRP